MSRNGRQYSILDVLSRFEVNQQNVLLPDCHTTQYTLVGNHSSTEWKSERALLSTEEDTMHSENRSTSIERHTWKLWSTHCLHGVAWCGEALSR